MVMRPLEFAFTARIISFVPRAISKLSPPSENFPTPCAKFKMNCLRTLPRSAGLHGIVPLPTFCSQTRALLGGRSFLGGSPTFNGKRAQKTGSGTCTIYAESCNKVTLKCNRVTSKEQSELTSSWAPFGELSTLPLTTFIEFEYSRPPVWPKNAAHSQREKRRKSYAEAQLELSRTKTSRTEHYQRYLLSLPPLCWGGWDGFYKSVFCKQHFSWSAENIQNQFYSKPQRNRSTYLESFPRRIVS